MKFQWNQAFQVFYVHSEFVGKYRGPTVGGYGRCSECSNRQRKAVLIKDKLFIDGKPYHPPATEADHLDAPVPAQGAEGHSSPGGRWERRDTRGGGRGRRTR